MAHRVKWFFVRNWQASLAILAVWFIYAAVRDGPSVHYHFLGLSLDEQAGPSRIQYPPWIMTFVVEAILLCWYFLPVKACCRGTRLLAAFMGALLLVWLLLQSAVFSHPSNFSLEVGVGVYIFASILLYAIFWPSELAI